MSQLRRWKRLWQRSLTGSHKRTSMGPLRSCWNGTKSSLQLEEITSKGTRVSCVYYQSKCPYEKSLETYLMILVFTSTVWTRGEVGRTYWERWMIGTDGEWKRSPCCQCDLMIIIIIACAIIIIKGRYKDRNEDEWPFEHSGYRQMMYFALHFTVMLSRKYECNCKFKPAVLRFKITLLHFLLGV